MRGAGRVRACLARVPFALWPTAASLLLGAPCGAEAAARARRYNSLADIWSFGITILELAHGHAPFARFPPMKVLLMTIQNPPPTLDSASESAKKHFSKARGRRRCRVPQGHALCAFAQMNRPCLRAAPRPRRPVFLWPERGPGRPRAGRSQAALGLARAGDAGHRGQVPDEGPRPAAHRRAAAGAQVLQGAGPPRRPPAPFQAARLARAPPPQAPAAALARLPRVWGAAGVPAFPPCWRWRARWFPAWAAGARALLHCGRGNAAEAVLS